MLFITCNKEGWTIEVQLSEVLYVREEASLNSVDYYAYLKNGEVLEIDPAPFGENWTDAIYKVVGRNE